MTALLEYIGLSVECPKRPNNYASNFFQNANIIPEFWL